MPRIIVISFNVSNNIVSNSYDVIIQGVGPFPVDYSL